MSTNEAQRRETAARLSNSLKMFNWQMILNRRQPMHDAPAHIVLDAYRIMRRESLGELARGYGVTVAQLRAAHIDAIRQSRH